MDIMMGMVMVLGMVSQTNYQMNTKNHKHHTTYKTPEDGVIDVEYKELNYYKGGITNG